MYAGYKDEFDDIFPLLSPMELNKFEFLLDETPFEATEFLEGFVNLPMENQDQEVTKVGSCVDQVRSRKRGRPKAVSKSENLVRERRNAANARERKRMNQMIRY